MHGAYLKPAAPQNSCDSTQPQQKEYQAPRTAASHYAQLKDTVFSPQTASARAWPLCRVFQAARKQHKHAPLRRSMQMP